MTILIIINDPPYRTERSYNAVRLANQILKDSNDITVKIFLLADAISCVVKNQHTPTGYYNIERMLKFAVNKGVEIKVCGSFSQARGIQQDNIIDGAIFSTMEELADWTIKSSKVISF